MSIMFAVKNVTHTMPNNANIPAIALPSAEIGVTSPYPIVVTLTNENQKALNIDPKWFGSLVLSTKYINDAITYVFIANIVIGKNVFAGLPVNIYLNLWSISLNSEL